MYTPALLFSRDKLKIIDQTRLPGRLEYIELDSIRKTCTAINKLKIRGAPALGIVAAYSLYLAARKVPATSYTFFKKQLDHFSEQLPLQLSPAFFLYPPIVSPTLPNCNYPGLVLFD